MVGLSFPKTLIMSTQLFETVSYHLWQPCNMKCRFCYATFQDVKREMNLPKGHQTKAETIDMIHLLAEHGVSKITFAGGEPMLCPWLNDLLVEAKILGLVTSIITNGSYLTQDSLNEMDGILDWLGVSIDSLHPDTLLRSGRAVKGKEVVPTSQLEKLIISAREQYRYKIKINTVVHALNWTENLSSFLATIQPDRWKVFQVLPMLGQNDACEDLLITKDQFQDFVNRHLQYSPVAESNDLMRSSYMLIDPAGRFFNDAAGFHTYSRPIVEVGIKEAFADVGYSRETFLKRGGIYKW